MARTERPDTNLRSMLELDPPGSISLFCSSPSCCGTAPRRNRSRLACDLRPFRAVGRRVPFPVPGKKNVDISMGYCLNRFINRAACAVRRCLSGAEAATGSRFGPCEDERARRQPWFESGSQRSRFFVRTGALALTKASSFVNTPEREKSDTAPSCSRSVDGGCRLHAEAPGSQGPEVATGRLCRGRGRRSPERLEAWGPGAQTPVGKPPFTEGLPPDGKGL